MSRDVGEPVDIRAEDAAVVSVVRYDIRPHVGLALLLVSFFWFSASALVIGIAAVLGSVALVGSNRGTLGEIITGIYAAFDVAHRHPDPAWTHAPLARRPDFAGARHC